MAIIKLGFSLLEAARYAYRQRWSNFRPFSKAAISHAARFGAYGIRYGSAWLWNLEETDEEKAAAHLFRTPFLQAMILRMSIGFYF
jgi:hypothetical protein